MTGLIKFIMIACWWSTVWGYIQAGNTTERTIINEEANESKGCLLPEPMLFGKFRLSHTRCPPGTTKSGCRLIPGAIVPHLVALYFTCDSGYQLIPKEHSATICKNGKWSAMPTCGPAINIISRDRWAENVESEFPEQQLPLTRVIIAHTATQPCTSYADCVVLAQSIQQVHKAGFDDIGYNFMVGNDGLVLEAQGWGRIGAHTFGYNTGSVCITLIGDYTNHQAPEAMLTAVKKLIEYGLATKKLAKDFKLNAHCQLIQVASPGRKVFEQIKSWDNWESRNAIQCTR